MQIAPLWLPPTWMVNNRRKLVVVHGWYRIVTSISAGKVMLR